jgi:putative CocE/NonD family hydrolase
MGIVKSFGPPSLVGAGFLSYTLLEYMRQKNIFRWYDYWLKGMDNGVMDGPAVRIFLMGANRWLEAETWPPPGITYQPVYLREGSGQTAASLNNGMLTFDLPREDELAESFRYDHSNVEVVEPADQGEVPKRAYQRERALLHYVWLPVSSSRIGSLEGVFVQRSWYSTIFILSCRSRR